jgi:hypothetical protein
MARRSSFDFPHTCPKIDKAIDACRGTLMEYLYEYIEKLSPLIPSDEVSRLSNDWSHDMYKAISDCFESVRETNEEMRDEANRQIAALEDEIVTLKEENAYLARGL